MSSPSGEKAAAQFDAPGFDPVAIRHVVDALRSRDFNKCREPEIAHVCTALERISALNECLDGQLGVYLLALANIREGAMSVTPPMAVAQASANDLGFGKDWYDEVQACIDANRSPEGYRRIVERLRKKNGCTQADAIRAVAKLAGIEEASVKKALQRDNKSRKPAQP